MLSMESKRILALRMWVRITGDESKSFEPKKRLSFTGACVLALAAIVAVIVLVYFALGAWAFRGAGH
jgi:hypothetical protein